MDITPVPGVASWIQRFGQQATAVPVMYKLLLQSGSSRFEKSPPALSENVGYSSS
jgi:hypothetical protein